MPNFRKVGEFVTINLDHIVIIERRLHASPGDPRECMEIHLVNGDKATVYGEEMAVFRAFLERSGK